MKSILIIDDQRGILLLLDEVFTKEKYQTYLANNGIEALRILEKEQIDCILLDMKIPGMNGIEILRRIKEMKPNVPVFMITATCEEEVIDEAKSLGVIKFFTKPFNIFEIVNEVNTTLSV